MSLFCRCKCFLRSNIYLKEYGLHITYQDESQFTHSYSEVLAEMGCYDLKPIILKIEEELKRRRKYFTDSDDRATYIRENYKTLHPNVYSLMDGMLHPDFHKVVGLAILEPKNFFKSKIIKSHPSQVFSFPLLTTEFCQQLIEELEHFNKSSIPKGRPNSMNNYGILLDELGFNERFLIPLREKFIEPLCKLLFPEESLGGFDSHKVFTVDYEESKDVELGFHFDNSEVTLNVCLLADGEGGELYFGLPDGSQGFGYKHHIGRAVLHKGSSSHCVLPLNAGRRVNLVMWMRNSRVRNNQCPMCKQTPDLEPVEHGWGEGFTRVR